MDEALNWISANLALILLVPLALVLFLLMARPVTRSDSMRDKSLRKEPSRGGVDAPASIDPPD